MNSQETRKKTISNEKLVERVLTATEILLARLDESEARINKRKAERKLAMLELRRKLDASV